MIEVRRLTPMDASMAGGLLLEYMQHTYRGILPDERLDALSVKRETGYCRTMIKDSTYRAVFGAFAENNLIGMAAVGTLRWKIKVPEAYKGEFHSLYIKPKFRGKYRIADLLWARTIEWLTEHRFNKAVAIVLEKNVSGRAFFEKRGAHLIAIKPGSHIWAGENLAIYGLEV